ncbi:MAG TPA: GNAT family N-acetyltransferase [Chitinophagaceae bacterium]
MLKEITSETVSKEYVITRLSKANLADVAKLHAAVYGVAADTGYFFKKYDTAYTGVENVGFIAYNMNKLPVAYYGVIPCFIQHENKTILAAQSADTMTHPMHRYKGMFVELSNMTFDLCRQLGVFLIFGFPNQNSYHGAVNKLGWKMTGTMTCFVIPVKTLPLESLSKRADILNKLYKRYSRFVVGKKLLPLNGVANSVRKDGFAGVWRNEEYFNYKRYNPTKVLRIGHAKIWVSDRQGLVIGDIEDINEKNFNSVINELKGIAKRLGRRQLQFHCSPGTSLHDLFTKKYKAIPSYPMLFQDFGSAISPDKIGFTFADIDIF